MKDCVLAVGFSWGQRENAPKCLPKPLVSRETVAQSHDMVLYTKRMKLGMSFPPSGFYFGAGGVSGRSQQCDLCCGLRSAVKASKRQQGTTVNDEGFRVPQGSTFKEHRLIWGQMYDLLLGCLEHPKLVLGPYALGPFFGLCSVGSQTTCGLSLYAGIPRLSAP